MRPLQIGPDGRHQEWIAEMLVQSHAAEGEIHLLPALLGAWPAGSVRGLRARGGFEVDIAWKDGKLAAAIIRLNLGRRAIVRLGERTVDIPTTKGGWYHVDRGLTVREAR